MSDDLRQTYDALYTAQYRSRISGFEWARREALRHFIPMFIDTSAPLRVMDYGAGRGLYFDLWRDIFPNGQLSCCEISTVALDRIRSENPEIASHCYPILENRAGVGDGLFDVVLSIEVMEHVEDLRAYLGDIRRILAPQGAFIWTTPCANAFSIEHVYNTLTGQIETTERGTKRWRWEDPTHLRRLRSLEIKSILEEAGFEKVQFRFRSHLFSFLLSSLPSLLQGRMERKEPSAEESKRQNAGGTEPAGTTTGSFKSRIDRIRGRIIGWDYRLFRRLPNGASMLGHARKKA